MAGSPRPRNDSVASSAMACATWTVPTTISGGSAFGSRCLSTMRLRDSPRPRAASMYSLPRSTSAAERAVRA